jgi:hypothetical protein
VICEDTTPFDLFYSPAFKNLLEALNPRYCIPSEETLKTMMQVYLAETVGSVKKILRKLDWYSLEKVIGNNWYLQGNAKQVQKKKEKVSALWKKYLVVCDIENGKEMKDLSSLIFDDKVTLYTGIEETKVENFANWILLAKDQKPFDELEAKFDWSNILIGWKMEVQDFAI